MSTQNPQKIQKKNPHPYFKLLPPLLICVAVVMYAAVNLAQSDTFFNIPLDSLTSNTNYTTFISATNLKSILSKYDKDILIDAIFTTSSNDQIIQLLDYLHQISPHQHNTSIPSNNQQQHIVNNTPSPTTSNTTNKLPTITSLPVQSDNTWQNISYHNKYIPEYHLISMGKELWNANHLKNLPNTNKPRRVDGKIHKPNNEEYDQLISLLIQRSSQYKDIIFYKDLAKYKLDLRTITLSDAQTFVTYPINERFSIYPMLRTVEYFLCVVPSGYGNGLSVYWGVRSLAYWMNYNFKINCKAYENNLDKNGKLSSFLPFSIASNANMDKATDVINENKTIITFMPGVDAEQHSVIHPTSLIFMYYNAYFQKIMNYETTKASIDYYDYTHRNDRRELIDKMSQTNDIVIHIRCGDVLQLMHHVVDWDYGFLTINLYKYVMNIGLKRKFGINWYDKMTEDTTVWILSQLSHNSARKGELKAMKDCDYLIHYIVDHGLREIFKPANVTIMYDSDVNDDFYRMLVAPLLFCSPSTFCLNAGIANMDGIVVMPNRGAWVNFFHIDDKKNSQSYIDDKEDFIVANNSHLLPKNQLVIDTEKAGWHCNKIDNYNFNKATYKQSVYAEKLAEYLVAH